MIGNMEPMTLTFASAADLSTEFRTTVTVFGILVLAIVVAFALSARNSPLAITFKTRCALGLLAFTGVVWYAYSSSYAQFITADVNGNQVRLVFAPGTALAGPRCTPFAPYALSVNSPPSAGSEKLSLPVST
jgi:hypothetical protein